MIVLLHVLIALSSIVSTTVLAVFPSPFKMRVSYSLIALTLSSGVYLVISTHAPILSSCLSGLAYLGVALSGVGVAHYRLAEK